MIAPVLLAMIVGTLIYGLWFGIDHSIRQLASEAARASVPGVTEVERNGLAQQQVQTSAPAYTLLKPANLQMSSGYDTSDPNLFRVTLIYDASSITLGLMGGIVPTPATRIQRTATIRRGGA